jgi:Uma2 family endonuclease
MTASAKPLPKGSLPPLESGMRLTSVEFERRYALYPDMRAELVEGVVYVASPMRHRPHGRPQAIATTWLGTYEVQRANVETGVTSTVRLDPDNNVQPDAFLRYLVGNSEETEDQYLAGAPELVCEVTASSASYDTGPKLRAYRRNGVQEYIIWQVFDEKLDWYSLEDGEYVPLSPDERGVIHSKVFPGLRLDVRALLAYDLAGVLAEQQRTS